MEYGPLPYAKQKSGPEFNFSRDSWNIKHSSSGGVGGTQELEMVIS